MSHVCSRLSIVCRDLRQPLPYPLVLQMFPSGPPGLFSLSVSRCEDQFVQPMTAEATKTCRGTTLCGWMNAHSVWMNDKTKANCIVISLFSLGFTVSAIHHYFLWYSGEVWIKFTQTLHDLYYSTIYIMPPRKHEEENIFKKTGQFSKNTFMDSGP